MSWFPHMGPNDAIIWARFILADQTFFEKVCYDIPVGQGAEFDVTAGGILGEGIKKLYQRKIDVVGVKDSTVYIVEVKPRATTAAIGQVKGYVTLFKRDYPEYKNVLPMIVTDSLMPEMQFLCDEEGVRISIV